MLWSCSMNDTSILKPVFTRRRRFQRGSLQKRKSANGLNWIAFWWQDHHRRSQILGPCAEMTRPEALAQMAKLLQPVNADVKSAHSSGPSRIGFAIAFFPSAAAGTLPLPAASE